MKLWPRKPETPTPPRANPTRIAVLEHDLLGIQPEPGTAAAVTIALRKTSDCIQHRPVEITVLGDPGPIAMCNGCGAHLVQNGEGDWVKP